MKVVIAGGHGAVARLTGRRLVELGHEVLGLVRDPAHVADLTDDGMSAAVLDLEAARTAELAELLAGADCALFAAGAGPGSGAARKDTVDRGAAVLLADAAVLAGVRTYLLLSSTGVDAVRDGAVPDGTDEVFLAYLRAKLAAEDDVLARPELDAVVVRPGHLTGAPATGRVRLRADARPGDVSRADVADVLAWLVEQAEAAPLPRGTVLELVAGQTPVEEAVRDAVRPGGTHPAPATRTGTGGPEGRSTLEVDLREQESAER